MLMAKVFAHCSSGMRPEVSGGTKMPAVEMMQLDRRKIDAVETAHVDVDLIGIGAGHVERVNPAGGAEGVARGAGVEAIGGQRFGAAEQFERLGRHDEMQEAFLRTDRAVAFGDVGKLGGHAKPHAPAMASAFVCLWTHPARANGAEGCGITIFHSFAASIQLTIASCTFFNASSGVSPSDMQPGRSGTVAR